MTMFVVMCGFIAGVFGAMVGSFLNVFIYRLPRETLSVNKPRRSFCPLCGNAIPWYDNIPVISYFFILSGKCRFCGSIISFRYPFVEILTLFLFAGLTLQEFDGAYGIGDIGLSGFAIWLVHLFLISAALVVTFIDLEFQIIPDEITYSGALLSPVICALLPKLQAESSLCLEIWNPHLAGFISSLGGAFVGGGTLFFIGILGKAFLKREALGMGDVKYMIFVGGLLGWEGALLVFFLGCATGSLIGLPVRMLTGRQEIPFGPLLSLGVLLVIFFRSEMMDFLLVTWPSWVLTLFN
ncbi:MAG: prepilin peptidase [Planctomycetota bacterium]